MLSELKTKFTVKSNFSELHEHEFSAAKIVCDRQGDHIYVVNCDKLCEAIGDQSQTPNLSVSKSKFSGLFVMQFYIGPPINSTKYTVGTISTIKIWKKKKIKLEEKNIIKRKKMKIQQVVQQAGEESEDVTHDMTSAGGNIVAG